MSHIPVNHPLRPIYRALGALAGVYLVVFGVAGLISTAGEGLFGQGDFGALGQGTNLFWSIVSVLVGAIVVIAAAIGKNSDVEVFKYFGWGIIGVGSYSLAFSRTDANFLNHTVGTVVVLYLLGMLLVTAGLYSKVVPSSQTGAPRQAREATSA
jgi:hypothetical protein